MLRKSFLAAAALIFAALAAQPAYAASCAQLQRELQALGSGGASAQAERYARSVIAQTRALEATRDQARARGCNGPLGGLRGECRGLGATLATMEARLADLQATQRRLGGGDTRRERQRLTAQLAAQGCGTTQAPRRSSTAASTSPVEARGAGNARRTRPPAGNLRTLCVRSCDGYFFPIAYASSRATLERDAAACSAMCPGTEVELHYHRVPHEEADKMISAATGRPYTEMQNAFRYRERNFSRPADCSCSNEAGGGYTVLGEGQASAAQPTSQSPSILLLPMPTERPDPARDPETQRNLDGGLTVDALRTLLEPVERPDFTADATVAPNIRTSAAEETGRAVRVVGPRFLPDR